MGKGRKSWVTVMEEKEGGRKGGGLENREGGRGEGEGERKDRESG